MALHIYGIEAGSKTAIGRANVRRILLLSTQSMQGQVCAASGFF